MNISKNHHLSCKCCKQEFTKPPGKYKQKPFFVMIVEKITIKDDCINLILLLSLPQLWLPLVVEHQRTLSLGQLSDRSQYKAE